MKHAGLGRMFPCPATYNTADSRVNHVVGGSKICHSGAFSMAASDLADLSFGQSRLAVSFPSLLPIFGNHIGHVVGLRASHQVRGADTANVGSVTAMQNVGRFDGKIAVRDDVSKDVGAAWPSVEVELAVPLRDARSNPDPTGTEFWAVLRDWTEAADLRPESDKVGSGILDVHRDDPLTRNRGAGPDLVRQIRGFSCVSIVP
jgi:hypothetical protein